jgi:hypothetical protein
MPTTLHYTAPLVAKDPSLIVPLAVVAGVGFGKAAYHDPLQTATTLAMTWGIFKGVGKVAKPITPTILKGDGYIGIGLKGFKKPVKTTIDVPAIQRGGVYELNLLQNPPTVPKQIVTGHARSPIPLAGIRTKSGVPPTEGITSMYRGLQIGKRWTPAEYYKASKIDITPTAKGTIFEARHGTQTRIGQLRYGNCGMGKNHYQQVLWKADISFRKPKHQ